MWTSTDESPCEIRRGRRVGDRRGTGGVGIAVGAGEEGSSRPTSQELQRVQDRLNAERESLARQGIFLSVTAPIPGRCVEARLVNPSAPNAEYLRRHFGPMVCVAKRPIGHIDSCSGFMRPTVPQGPVTVPAVEGMSLFAAQKRLARDGLAWAVDCPSDRQRRPRRPNRFSIKALATVTRQCPRPGETVRAGEVVALDAVARMPGGFNYDFGILVQPDIREACVDGRTAVG
jgi:hypothetical protein